MYSKISDGLTIMKTTDFSPDGEGGEMYPNNRHIRSMTFESAGVPNIETHDFEDGEINFPPQHQSRRGYQDSHQREYQDSHQREYQDPRRGGYQDASSHETAVVAPILKRQDDRRDMKALKGDRPHVRFEGLPSSHQGGVQSDVSGGSLIGYDYPRPSHPQHVRTRNPPAKQPVVSSHVRSYSSDEDDIEFLMDADGNPKHTVAPPNLHLPLQTPVPPPGLTFDRGFPMCWAFCKKCKKKEGLRSCDCLLSTNFICEKCGWVYVCHENDNCKVLFWRNRRT